MNHTRICLRAAAFALAALMLAKADVTPAAATDPVAFEETSRADKGDADDVGNGATNVETEEYAEQTSVRPGVYRIKNAYSGKYLDVYRESSKSAGKTYCATFAEKDEGQIFLVDAAENGTYTLVPQNDGGDYALTWHGDDKKDSVVLTKVSAAEKSNETLFDIMPCGDGFSIALPFENGRSEVVAELTTVSVFGDVQVGIAPYDSSNTSQIWYFEKVETEKIGVAYNSTSVRLYSSGEFFAKKYPYDLIDDVVWSSDDNRVLMVGTDGRYCALECGTVTVTATADGVSASFTVEVSDNEAFSWFSQNNVYTSDWSASELEGLKFGSTLFAVDDPNGNKYSWIDVGCALCSVSMVLRNMGATLTTGYDLRTGQTDNLAADPYTVALANSGNYGVESVKEKMYGNPVNMNWRVTAARFNVDGDDVSYRRVYGVGKATIKKLLDQYPQGIIAELSLGNNTHYIVITKCLNPEEKNSSKLRFAVSDPAAYKAEDGDNVAFEDSTAYKMGYRYSSIRSIITYERVSE